MAVLHRHEQGILVAVKQSLKCLLIVGLPQRGPRFSPQSQHLY
jgi:hypothetical protein